MKAAKQMIPTKKTTIIILMVLALSLYSCGSGSSTKGDKKTSRTDITTTAPATINNIIQWYEAVGTIRPKTETSIEAQVTAQINRVEVAPGTRVSKGQTLIVLDNRQLLSQLDRAKEGLKAARSAREQAKQALASAEAGFTQADSDYKRTQNYFKSQAATSQDLEKAKASWLQAKAGVKKAEEALTASESGIKQAEELVKQAEISLEYTIIKAPDDGEVLKKMADPGDIALPGKPLVILRTSRSLRLEAHVREGLITKVSPGSRFDVDIKTLGTKVPAIIDEIEPYADPETRTFLVKAVLPDMESLYPGMYGKLLIPAAEANVVTIPAEAVRTVGQLELVTVQENDTWKTQYIKTGARMDGRVEVLSGLSGNEIVGY